MARGHVSSLSSQVIKYETADMVAGGGEDGERTSVFAIQVGAP